MTNFLSDEDVTLSRYRYGHDASFDRAAGWLYEGMAKAFARTTPRASRSSETIQCRSPPGPGQTRRAPARPIRWPISRRWSKSSISYNQLEHHRLSQSRWANRFSRMSRKTSRWPGWPMRSSRRRASIRTARSESAKHNAVLRERTDWLTTDSASTRHTLVGDRSHHWPRRRPWTGKAAASTAQERHHNSCNATFN